MRVVMEGAGFIGLLTVALGMAVPSFAQAPEPTASASEELGSVIVFPKFTKGKVTVDDATKTQTEIEVRARCPKGATCPDAEPVKIRFHWVCPGGEDAPSKYVCKEADFDVSLSVNERALIYPEDPELPGNNAGSVAPCPSGYLIGWVISPATGRPIKYDGLTGSATLRDRGGAVGSYEPIKIQADPTLATRAELATDIDPRTGIPALVFDGGPGHYQALAGGVPTGLEYRKLTGPLASSEGFLVLLTLDVRLNRPNYPTIVDLEFRTDQGNRSSNSWNFECWSEIQSPNIDANYTLVGARTGNAIVIAGQAIKVPLRGISDVPGPVTLLGLVPTEASGTHRTTMEPAYIVERLNSSKPTTVLVPSQ